MAMGNVSLMLNKLSIYKIVYLCSYNLEVDEISHIHRSLDIENSKDMGM